MSTSKKMVSVCLQRFPVFASSDTMDLFKITVGSVSCFFYDVCVVRLPLTTHCLQ